jgi:AcrR family transcriptional regulator
MALVALDTGIMAKIPPIKRRDAAATRAAILAAAGQRFLHESYDSVGLRDIAGDAGVDVALISRYFGGKEGLFVEALIPGQRQGIPSDMTVEKLPDYLCDLVLADDGIERNHRMEMFIIMLRSASSPKAGEIIRRQVNDDMLAPIIALLSDDSAAWRANMLLAMLMGVGVLRSVMESDGLACMAQDPDEYRARFRALFETILKI